MNAYLDSSDKGLNRNHFYRMLALGCFDVFITLPSNTTSLIISVLNGESIEFYEGWTFIHSEWEPILIPKTVWSIDKWTTFLMYWDMWINPFFALIFFALFGFTAEAKECYRRLLHILCRPFRSKQAAGAEDLLPDVVFKSEREIDVTITSSISSRWVIIICFFQTLLKLNWEYHFIVYKQMCWSTSQVNGQYVHIHSSMTEAVVEISQHWQCPLYMYITLWIVKQKVVTVAIDVTNDFRHMINAHTHAWWRWASFSKYGNITCLYCIIQRLWWARPGERNKQWIDC